MTTHQDSSHPADWLRVAQKDWRRAEIMLEEKDVEAVAYFLQQSLEKYLKGFLLSRGWKLKKTHELDALLDAAAGYEPSLEAFRDLCERVSGYYLVQRYPPLATAQLTSGDIKKDIGEAKAFIAALLRHQQPGYE